MSAAISHIKSNFLSCSANADVGQALRKTPQSTRTFDSFVSTISPRKNYSYKKFYFIFLFTVPAQILDELLICDDTTVYKGDTIVLLCIM